MRLRYLMAVWLFFSIEATAAISAGIEDVYPQPNAVDVPLSANIVLSYSLPATYNYTNDRHLRVVETATNVEVFSIDPELGDAQDGQTQYVIQLEPGQLEYGKHYTVTLDPGFGVINQAPWKTGVVAPGAWTFTTETLSSGSVAVDNVSSVYPAPGATLVPVDIVPIIEFSAPANYAYTDYNQLYVREVGSGEVVFQANPDANDAQQGSNTYLLHIPVGTLKANRAYEILVDYAFAGVNQAPWKTGQVVSGAWQFTTGPAGSAPLASPVDGFNVVSPAPGSINIDPNTSIRAHFTSDLFFANTDQNEISVVDVATNEVVFSVDPDELHEANGRQVFHIDLPLGSLKENTTYEITSDYQFAYFAAAPWRTAVLDSGAWTFTTGQADPVTLAPAVNGIAGVYPANGANNVASNTSIDVHFQSPILFGYTEGSSLSLIDTRDNSIVESLDPAPADVQEGQYKFQLQPAAPLEAGVTYEVGLDWGFARFNEAPWISSDVSEAAWTFTVAGVLATPEPPPVEEETPTDPVAGGDPEQPPTDEEQEPENPVAGGGEQPPIEQPPTTPGVTETTGTVMFVTQTPVDGVSFATVINNFSNHTPGSRRAPRGGDLWIRYADGSLRNLTAEAGFGEGGLQGQNSIAVRSPSVHWDGTKAIFSMVVGSPALYETTAYYWQLYEVTGLGQGEVATITKLPNQPVDYNNVSPIYAESSLSNAAGEDIIFVSDITKGGRHLYPQYEEYDGATTNTGLFRLTPSNGNLKRLTHAPSGDFTPIIDDYGRLIFVRWDHLMRDQQNGSLIGGVERFGAAINYVDESPNAPVDTVNGAVDIFPEHLIELDPVTSTAIQVNNETGHRFNQFFLWQSSPIDGSENEVLNHLGRQELGMSYSIGRFTDDPALEDITTSFLGGNTANTVSILAPGGTFHPKEDPNESGAFYMTHMQEFAFCGEIVRIAAAPDVNPEAVVVEKRTEYFDAPVADGCYRNPLPMQDGVMIAAYSPEDFGNEDNSDEEGFRLRFVNEDGTPGAYLTSGLSKEVSYYSPDFLLTHNDNLWELDPVEVKVRAKPAQVFAQHTTLSAPEQAACETAFGDTAACNAGMTQFRQYLEDNELALVISRNVTSRDDSDTQQPYNLRVPGGVTSDSSQGTEKIYDVTHLQFFQANLVRGYANRPNGRRPLAQFMADDVGNGLNSSSDGAVQLGTDGSAAAIVPAERAMTWHLVDEAQNNKSIVTERYWVSFAAGEVRVCANCHGINGQDQMGNPEPTNPPQAFTAILNAWQAMTNED